MLDNIDAGTMLDSAMGQPDPLMDMMTKMLTEFQQSKAAAEEHHMEVEADADEHLLKAEDASWGENL